MSTPQNSNESSKKKRLSKQGEQEDKAGETESNPSLVNQMIGLTSQLTSSALEMARSGRFIPLIPIDKVVKEAYLKTLDPIRVEAMVDAGHFLKDARQVAGLNVNELSEAVGLSDTKLLEDVEKGVTTLPFDMILRIASLTARHDPIPFILKFLRTYNPDLERGLQQWGVSQWPQHYERERRFINIYRQHDKLRNLSDEEYSRFIGYLDAATDLTLDIMMSEKNPEAHNTRDEDEDEDEDEE
jgi:hypothetical protein